MKYKYYYCFIILIIFSLLSCVSTKNLEKISNEDKSPIDVVMLNQNIGSDKLTVYKIQQNSSRGYNINAYLTIPEEVVHPYIIVSPYKTNKITPYEKKDEAIYRKIIYNTKSWQGSVFEETKAIGLYLVIPEIRDDFRHLALDPEILLLRDKFSHIERQVAALLKDVIEYTNEILQLNVKDRVDMIGYSGEANFVTRFSLFYPELMHSACAGGASWTPALPVTRLYSETLKYPLGTADFKNYSGVSFNIEEWRKINFFIDMGLLDERGSYNHPRLKELNKFKDIKLTTKNYKEIWSDFCDVYVNSTERAQMVTYHYVGHSANYKDYVAFLIANRSDDFNPLTEFSSKVTYKTASGTYSAGDIPNIFALVNDSYAVKSGDSIIGNKDNKFKLTIYVDGVPCSDFTFTQSSPEYGTIDKQKAVLSLKDTKQNKRGSKILIKANDNKYYMTLKWHD